MKHLQHSQQILVCFPSLKAAIDSLHWDTWILPGLVLCIWGTRGSFRVKKAEYLVGNSPIRWCFSQTRSFDSALLLDRSFLSAKIQYFDQFMNIGWKILRISATNKYFLSSIYSPSRLIFIKCFNYHFSSSNILFLYYKDSCSLLFFIISHFEPITASEDYCF